MRILKSHTFLNPINSYLIDSPQPSNLSYLWNFGSLLGLSLMIQIITGVVLAMHYNPSITEAFNSVEHIMRDVNNGWLIRYLHSNTASAFFFLVYLHIGRGLYYGSYRAPRTLVWTLGTFIFILMMAIAFLGYIRSPKWFKIEYNKKKAYLNKIKQDNSNKNNNNNSRPDDTSVIDFLKINQLKPVFVYEELGKKCTQDKILNDTFNTAGVYLILNKVNLSFYVGSASTNKFISRFRKHLFNFSGSKIVKAAVKKYKINNFAFIILEVFPSVVTKENNKNLLDTEDYYIKSLLPDYNIVTEAGNTFGYKHSEITRIKMANNYSLERRIAIGNMNRGKTFTDQHKKNMRAAALTRKAPTYSKQGLANMCLSSKPLVAYNPDKTVYGQYFSISAAAEPLKCCVKTISRSLNTPKKVLKNRWIVELKK